MSNWKSYLILSISLTMDLVNASPNCVPSTSWKTVDLYQREPGTLALMAGLTTFQRTAYATGWADNNWIVRRSMDYGETWSTILDLPESRGRSIAVDPRNGHVYTAGIEGRSGINYRWVVRKSVDRGLRWRVVDNFQDADPAANRNVVSRITVDAKGNVIAIGYRDDFSTNPTPIMRRSEDGGVTWKNIVFAEQPFDGRVLLAGPTGQVLVGGYNIPPRPDLHGPKWAVRYSPNGKSGWTQVDSFSLSSDATNSSAPYGGSISPDGRVALVGFADENSSDTRHWVTRMSHLTNIGIWTTQDNYRPLDFSSGFGEAIAQNATFGHTGRMFVNGRERSPTSEVWGSLVREGHPPITLFTPSDKVLDSTVQSGEDEYIYSGGLSTMANGQVLSGSVLQVGIQKAWLVRKMTCPL